MAELYALRLHEIGVPKNAIICYGIASPPASYQLLAEYGVNLMGDRIHRLRHEKDPIKKADNIGTRTLASKSNTKSFGDSNIKNYYLTNGEKHYIKDTYLPYILSNISWKSF